jgi:hypothetical protein
MWKIWPIKNHEWIRTFHPTLDGKKKIKKKEKEMKTLDEKSYMQIMDENLPFG